MVILIYLCLMIFTLVPALENSGPDRFPQPESVSDSLPLILSKNHSDHIGSKLIHEANMKSAVIQIPYKLEEWESYKTKLRNDILRKTGVIIDHELPLNIKETGTIKMKGYSVRNLTFQTRPGVYVTANLYIPDGNGPFPAVINMVGHFRKGKIDVTGQQAVGHSLALNGYVCLTPDPWGAGERATKHGVFEYHGANLGASLMNIGESLMGIQISDNMRGVDLLCSLPFVDRENIGATGASGGGNQTMWLSAVDERIKAAIPVVSVGTLESYIMRSQCICELLIDGLTFTEEAGVLALSRAIMPCNHQKDVPVFIPSEMLRSYSIAKKIFELRNEKDHIAFRIFDLTHGYMAEDREAALGWFDYHLKGIGAGLPKKEVPFELLPEEKLMVYPSGQRSGDVISTDEYCKRRGNELRNAYLNVSTFNTENKRNELRGILRIKEKPYLKKIHQYSALNGWNRFALETSNNKLIPLLHKQAVDTSLGYVILCDPRGKKNISIALIDELGKKGFGLVVVDLTGTGESSSSTDLSNFGGNLLHTLAIGELWLGKTLLGDWVEELSLVTGFLDSNYDARKISIDGNKEAGLAGLFLGALDGNIDSIILRNAPVSYLFDDCDSIDFFSMAIHLPGFLNWGDVSLAAALTGTNITFIKPVTMSGHLISNYMIEDFNSEFKRIRNICKKKGFTMFL